LQQAFEIFGRHTQGKTRDAIKGILAEDEEIMEEYAVNAAFDVGLLADGPSITRWRAWKSPIKRHRNISARASSTDFR
jgi:hypothetical protein